MFCFFIVEKGINHCCSFVSGNGHWGFFEPEVTPFIQARKLRFCCGSSLVSHYEGAKKVCAKWGETFSRQLHLLLARLGRLGMDSPWSLGHWERLGGSNVGAEIKGKWGWSLGCTSGRDSATFWPLCTSKSCSGSKNKHLILGHRVVGRVFPLLVQLQAEEFSLCSFGCPWNDSPNALWALV